MPTPKADTSYGMGWFVGPINHIPAILHQGETFNFHANAVLVPASRTGVVVLINAENSVDLFLSGRMGTISEGVTSLLEGRKPSPPPSRAPIFLAYALLFGAIVLQLRGMTRSAVALRRGRVRGGRLGPRLRIGLSLALNLGWALLVLVLVPRQLGLPLRVAAQGLPDIAGILPGQRRGRPLLGDRQNGVVARGTPKDGPPRRGWTDGGGSSSHEQRVSAPTTSHRPLPAYGLARWANGRRHESALPLSATGLIALRLVDDNFLQSKSGPPASDHPAGDGDWTRAHIVAEAERRALRWVLRPVTKLVIARQMAGYHQNLRHNVVAHLPAAGGGES